MLQTTKILQLVSLSLRQLKSCGRISSTSSNMKEAAAHPNNTLGKVCQLSHMNTEALVTDT